MSHSTSFATGGDYAGKYDQPEYEFAKKKLGSAGREIPIIANYIPIKVSCTKIYHYNINIDVHDFIVEKGDKNVPQRNRLAQQKKLYRDNYLAVFDRFIKQETQLFSSEPVFDGSKNIYSTTKINIPDRAEFQVKQKVQERKFPMTFDVILTTPKDSHELDMSVLNDPNIQKAEKEIQALDIILRYGAKKYKLAIGANLFPRAADLVSMSPQERQRIRFDLGEMKEVSFGHYQSAKLTQNGTQLNIDRVAIVLNKGGKILKLMEQLITEMRSGPQRRDGPPPRQITIDSQFKLNSNERTLLNNELKGLSFEVDHISYKPKSKIFSLTDKTVSQIFFDQKTRDSDKTVQVSVKEYFEKVYKDYLDKRGLNGLNPNLPCVQVGKNNPKFFPLEVVSIIDDQYYSRKLKPRYQSTMTRTCGQQKPNERFKEGIQQLKALVETKAGQTDYLKQFNIKMDRDYTQLQGRILDDVSLLYNNNKVTKPREGQWRSENYVIPSTNVGSEWMVINFVKDYSNPIRFAPKKDQIDDFIKALMNAARNRGVNLTKPVDVVYDEVYKGRNDLDDAMADYIQDHPNLKLMIFFIPNLDELYSNIKYLSEIFHGVVTQCVSQEKSKQFSSPSYVSNLLLKINAKLGGTNAHLDASCKVGFLKKKTMIMGLDVTHPGFHDPLGNSVASVVATYDSKMVNYYSKNVVQPKPKQEIVLLDEICCEMLENFRTRNKFLPDYIVVYRDGVSDGQFNEVVDKEINLMKKAFTDLSPNYSPKITYIIVQKRHHTRFLAANERDRIQRSQNVLPGTVVDNSIVSNYYHDFYLCPHFGALGTTRPTRFIVLHDDSEFSGDDIQKTTNLLCYLFPRCEKAVSVPAPVLYAHLSAKRARTYLFALDSNRGQIFGEAELSPEEIKDLNKKIVVKESLKNILYYV